MANDEHLKILMQGAEVWNQWREDNVTIKPDLRGAHLREIYLPGGINLSGVDLRSASLSHANLMGYSPELSANLSYARLEGAHLNEAKLCNANLSGASLDQAFFNKSDLVSANFSNASLTGTGFKDAYLWDADFTNAKFIGTDLRGAHLKGVNFSSAIFLSNINLSRTELLEANFRGANVSSVDFSDAILTGADFSNAVFSDSGRKAILTRANLSGANLRGAILSGVNLSEATMVNTNLSNANLNECLIYGISAWDLVLDNTTQTGLIITKIGDPVVTVDDIEVAQFVHFMLNNEKIRRVMNALTSKAVLILGRFTEKRKEILDALRDKLSGMDYLPIIFDFEKTTDRDFTETVLTLACLSKFVIIDLTDPSSTPHESKTTIPDLQIPFLPIIQEGQTEYAMFRNFEKYPWVLDGKTYKDKNDLIQYIEKLTEAAEAKHLEIRAQKDNVSSRFTPISD